MPCRDGVARAKVKDVKKKEKGLEEMANLGYDDTPVIPGSSYKVQKGDTLASISRATYGDARQWQRIFSANSDKLSSPDRIIEGMVIYLPPSN